MPKKSSELNKKKRPISEAGKRWYEEEMRKREEAAAASVGGVASGSTTRSKAKKPYVHKPAAKATTKKKTTTAASPATSSSTTTVRKPPRRFKDPRYTGTGALQTTPTSGGEAAASPPARFKDPRFDGTGALETKVPSSKKKASAATTAGTASSRRKTRRSTVAAPEEPLNAKDEQMQEEEELDDPDQHQQDDVEEENQGNDDDEVVVMEEIDEPERDSQHQGDEEQMEEEEVAEEHYEEEEEEEEEEQPTRKRQRTKSPSKVPAPVAYAPTASTQRHSVGPSSAVNRQPQAAQQQTQQTWPAPQRQSQFARPPAPPQRQQQQQQPARRPVAPAPPAAPAARQSVLGDLKFPPVPTAPLQPPLAASTSRPAPSPSRSAAQASHRVSSRQGTSLNQRPQAQPAASQLIQSSLGRRDSPFPKSLRATLSIPTSTRQSPRVQQPTGLKTPFHSPANHRSQPAEARASTDANPSASASGPTKSPDARQGLADLQNALQPHSLKPIPPHTVSPTIPSPPLGHAKDGQGPGEDDDDEDGSTRAYGKRRCLGFCSFLTLVAVVGLPIMLGLDFPQLENIFSSGPPCFEDSDVSTGVIVPNTDLALPDHCSKSSAKRIPCPRHGICTHGILQGCDSRHFERTDTECVLLEESKEIADAMVAMLEQWTRGDQCTWEGNPYVMDHEPESSRPLFLYSQLAGELEQGYDLQLMQVANQLKPTFLVKRTAKQILVGLDKAHRVRMSIGCHAHIAMRWLLRLAMQPFQELTHFAENKWKELVLTCWKAVEKVQDACWETFETYPLLTIFSTCFSIWFILILLWIRSKIRANRQRKEFILKIRTDVCKYLEKHSKRKHAAVVLRDRFAFEEFPESEVRRKQFFKETWKPVVEDIIVDARIQKTRGLLDGREVTFWSWRG